MHLTLALDKLPLRREVEVQAEIRTSADAVEGRNAFLEKRVARFSGR